MPPMFSETHFDFSGFDEVIPDHIDVWPNRDEIDPNKFRIEEIDTFDEVINIIAADIDTIEQAILLRAARNAYLERTGVVVIEGAPRIKLGLPIRKHPGGGPPLVA